MGSEAAKVSISREVLAKYITPGCVFVESGCRWGDACIRAAELGAGAIYTCEIDSQMAAIARHHLADAIKKAHFEVDNVESVEFLRENIASRAIVFLDAHTETYSPILDELKVIAEWKFKPSVILIDDLRCMDAWHVSSKDLLKAVRAVGECEITHEDGVEPNDILVASYS